MFIKDVKTLELRGVSIRDFDAAFQDYQSCNIPLRAMPEIHAVGLRSPEFKLVCRSNTQASIQENTLSDDDWFFHLPYPQNDTIEHYLNHVEGVSHAMVSRPGKESIFHVMGNSPCVYLGVKQSLLDKAISSPVLDQLMEKSEGLARKDLSEPLLRSTSAVAFLKLLTWHRAVQSGSGSISRDELNKLLVDVAGLVLDADGDDYRQSNRHRILDRSLRFIQRHYAADVHVDDIVNYAHSTSRSLQLAFKTQFNVTPLQYVFKTL